MISTKVEAMSKDQMRRLKKRIRELANNNGCVNGLADRITCIQLTSPARRKFIRTVYEITDDDIDYIMKNG